MHFGPSWTVFTKGTAKRASRLHFVLCLGVSSLGMSGVEDLSFGFSIESLSV